MKKYEVQPLDISYIIDVIESCIYDDINKDVRFRDIPSDIDDMLDKLKIMSTACQVSSNSRNKAKPLAMIKYERQASEISSLIKIHPTVMMKHGQSDNTVTKSKCILQLLIPFIKGCDL